MRSLKWPTVHFYTRAVRPSSTRSWVAFQTIASVLLAALAGCSLEVGFSESAYRCEDGQTCPSGFDCVHAICIQPSPDVDATAAPDAPEQRDGATAQALVDDSAEDFTGSFEQAALQARGAIEPYAYYTGGVLQRASDSGVIASGGTTTWAQVQAFASTGQAAIARSTDLAWGSGETPAGIGLSHGDSWTLSFEGEVWLAAGTWTFQLDADDHAFVELAPADASAFERVVSADFPTVAQGSFVATADGWYPIRWAGSDDGGAARATLRFQGPGVGSATPIPRHRLRVRAVKLTGLVLAATDDLILLGDHQTTLDIEAPADVDWGSGRPADLGLTSDDSFSVRWTGQLRVDVAGAYSFRYDTDDGQRLWIDGARLLDAWDTSPHEQVTASVDLEVGWHDLVIDSTDAGSFARALLTVETGPDLVGLPLPVSRLRPVEGRAERYETGFNRGDVSIPDSGGGTAQTTITFDAPAGAQVTGLELSYTFDHTFPADLVVTLIAPSGAQLLLRNRVGGGTAVVGDSDHYVFTAANGLPVAGTWALRFADLEIQDVGVIRDFQLTLHHDAGEPPVPALAAYESPVRDLGNVVIVERVSWNARVPAGSDVAVLLRTCATAEACAAEPWSAALVDASGATPPDVAPRRFVQYRVELGSSGDAAAALEAVRIDYWTSP